MYVMLCHNPQCHYDDCRGALGNDVLLNVSFVISGYFLQSLI
jgi:hypothetical protein